MIRIAFLMQCHKNSEQINCLLKALEHPQVDIFVHIDSKSENIRKEIDRHHGVYLLSEKDCVNVQWGQFSQVQATLNLLDAAVYTREYSHYFLISGQDYPLKTIGGIVNYLGEHEENNFIECNVIKKFEKRNDIYFPNAIIGRKLWQKVLKSILVYGTGGWSHTFHILKRQAPSSFNYYFGSSWWCLNKTMMEWIYDYLNKRPEYKKLFSHSLCSDECFFQTLVMNSPYKESVRPYLHYTKWGKGKSSPQILTMADYEELKKTNKVIARKFDVNVDRGIIEKLRNG